MAISFDRRLRLDYIDGRKWLLVLPLWFSYASPNAALVDEVPAQFVTDFHSIPRLLWRVLFPTDYGQAAVIHDYLYRYKLMPRAECDRAYRDALVELQAPGWKVNVMYAGVRVGGWRAYRKKANERPAQA